MANKQYIVIGLGRFGSSVAKTLYKLDCEVVAVDSDVHKVEEISDFVTHSMCFDATDEAALKQLGVSNFDVAVVAIGSDIQASIMVTLALKELGVPFIVSKSSNKIHSKILYKIGADKVIQPENDIGIRIAHNIVSSSVLDYIQLSDDYRVNELVVPDEWTDKSIYEMNFREKYHISVVAIKREKEIIVSPNNEDVLRDGDIIVCICKNQDIDKITSFLR